MAVDITQEVAINPTNPEYADLLKRIQGNILKGHGRDYAAHIFFSFSSTSVQCRQWLQEFCITNLTSAWAQLEQATARRELGIADHPFVNVFLTKAGYDALGLGQIWDSLNRAAPFVVGAKARSSQVRPPPSKGWEDYFDGSIHGMILIANSDEDQLHTHVYGVKDDLATIAQVLKIEWGRTLRNATGKAIEHFGYVDGRSQPQFLARDIEKEKHYAGDIAHWNPTAPLDLVLTSDPGAPGNYGSFLVFNKLEQNVAGFNARTRELAARLDLVGEEAKRAGAMVVGRFKDGTPLSEQSQEGSGPINNFTYEEIDADGRRCPFQAHIRKVNPRGETARIGGSVRAERRRRIVRRGITYGQRDLLPNGVIDPSHEPERDVGLLFMCYQSDIAEQFEFIQQRWANNKTFLAGHLEPPLHDPGIDPLIGQGANAVEAPWPVKWGEAQTLPFDFSGFVTTLGGEYFFAPSVTFLTTLNVKKETQMKALIIADYRPNTALEDGPDIRAARDVAINIFEYAVTNGRTQITNPAVEDVGWQDVDTFKRNHQFDGYGWIAIVNDVERMKTYMGYPNSPFCKIYDIKIIELNGDAPDKIYENMTPASWRKP